MVRTACNHVYHSYCLARWANLRDEEAAAVASEATSSTRAERDAVEQEVARAVKEEAAAVFAVGELTALAERQAYEQKLAQAWLEARGNSEAEMLFQLEFGHDAVALAVELTEDPARSLEAGIKEMPKAQEQVRKARRRLADLERRLRELEESLSLEATQRASLALPCPVCRTPLDRLRISDVPSDAVIPAVEVAEATVGGSPAQAEVLTRAPVCDEAASKGRSGRWRKPR